MSTFTESLRRIGSPFWRMYLFSVMQLLLAMIAAFFVVNALEGPLPHAQIRLATIAAISGHFHDGEPDDEALEVLLETLDDLMNRDLAVYDSRDALLASAGKQIAPPLPSGQSTSLVTEQTFDVDGRTHIAFALDKKCGGAYLVARGDQLSGPPLNNIIIGLSTMLLVLALLTVPLAYKITLPFQKIIDTAKKLAAGDLTARTNMRYRGDIGRLSRNVDNMADRLQARIESEKELLANVSHEIRTPLARIRVAQEMCTEQGTSLEEMKSSLDGIGEDVQELENLIDDVLKASRLDLAESGSGRADIGLRLEPTNMREVTDRSARRFASMHPEHHLEVNLPDELPAMEADPSLIRRLVDNLLDNAAKYSDTSEPIEIAVASEDEHIVVEVSDRGVGVEQSDLEKIFEPFYRAETVKTRYTAGSGLGLALCKHIAEAHGGSITASRRDGGGLVISFFLPVSD